MRVGNIDMIPVVTYDGGITYMQPGLNGLGADLFATIKAGSSQSPDPFSKAINVVSGFLAGIVTKSKFFDARNALTESITQSFAQYFGLNSQKMLDYYWKRISNPGTNEKKVMDDWWAVLNAQCIGDSGCSGDYLHESAITTHNLTGYWKKALDRLNAAADTFLAKYFSKDGSQEQANLVNSIQTGQQNVALLNQIQAGLQNGTLKAGTPGISADGKTILMVTAWLGLLYAGVSFAKYKKWL